LKVLLVVKTKSPDAKEHESVSYLSLGEGDKQGGGTTDKQGVIEVVKVDVNAGTVDIVNSGTPVTLSMKDNGLEHFAAAPAAEKKSAEPIALPLRYGNGMTPAMAMRETRRRENAARKEPEQPSGIPLPRR
jgi:hypothetical protein